MTDSGTAADELRGLDVRTDTAIADQDGATLQEIFADPLRDTFGRLLELATVIAYGGAEVMLDLEPAR